MNFPLALMMVALFAGCGHPLKLDIQAGQAQLASFVVEVRARNKNIEVNDLVVKLGTLVGNTVGLCSAQEGSTPVITLDSAFWSRATEIEKEVLMFHELGHCILGKDHVPPNAVMQAYLLDDDAYSASRKELLDELLK